ncbi:ROK family protein [Rhodobacteraceae bacterium W635]|uniref:glucokinase n=1 Tax=Nioella halotolerans TaxID=2303578 RepID=UPI000E3B88A3|nr:ROK family protein [Rhodobacteraceae bacterium W635]
MHRDLSLVADIGGTNTRVALARGTEVLPDSVRRYPNASADGLPTLLRRYLDELAPGDLTGACVAVAGPVRDGVGEITNIDWTFDRDMLGTLTGARKLAVLNDLQAQGHALGLIAESDLTRLLPQPAAAPKAARLVVGVGTGFNAAPVYDTAGGRFVPPSECGHISLPRHAPEQAALAETLVTHHGFASIEDALSGRGFTRIHRHLHGEEADGKAIVARLEAGDPAARETARLFVQLLGTVLGDLALIHLPFGGIYLIGGMARAVTPWVGPLGLAEAFAAKGRFSEFMDQFGIAVVEDDYAALTGCASHLRHLPIG